MNPNLEDVLFLKTDLHSAVNFKTVSNNFKSIHTKNLNPKFNIKKSNARLKIENKDDYFSSSSSNKFVGSKSIQNKLTAINSLQLFIGGVKDQVNDKTLEQMIVDHLNGQFYSSYVKYFKSNYKDSLDKSMKSAKKSVEARIKGNKLFAKESHDVQAHEEIWKMYSTSVAFAPNGSKELVLAYECRSNLLFHFEKYDDCVKDIDRALAITDFFLLKVKLLCRKMSCFVAMNKVADKKKDLWQLIQCDVEKIDEVFKDEKFFEVIKQAKTDSLSDPVKEIRIEKRLTPALISFPNVALTRNKEIGIVANRDFVPGEEVIVTKPLVTSFNPDKSYAYCSHCLSFMWAGVPCNECSLCMYCSEECKTEAWNKYHCLECKVLPHINVDEVMYFYLQSSVKIFMVGLREFGSISKLKEEIEKLRDDPKLIQNDKLFDSDFLNFYITPCTKINCSYMPPYIKNACFLLTYMIQACDIFDESVKSMNGKKLSKNDDIVFCGFLMTKILLSNIDNCVFPDEAHKQVSKRCNVGTIFHPFQGMFEKSCNPNVTRCWTDDGKIIYLCTQPIKKMAKISICDPFEFYAADIEIRFRCERGFKLYCSCTACLKNWPSMIQLYKKFEQRRLKSETKETKLVQKYLEKNNMRIDEILEENWELNDVDFQVLTKDVEEILNICGQPSFASSFMIAVLCIAYKALYEATPLQSHIPKVDP